MGVLLTQSAEDRPATSPRGVTDRFPVDFLSRSNIIGAG